MPSHRRGSGRKPEFEKTNPFLVRSAKFREPPLPRLANQPLTMSRNFSFRPESAI
jgi:hypothetical protein